MFLYFFKNPIFIAVIFSATFSLLACRRDKENADGPTSHNNLVSAFPQQPSLLPDSNVKEVSQNPDELTTEEKAVLDGIDAQATPEDLAQDLYFRSFIYKAAKEGHIAVFEYVKNRWSADLILKTTHPGVKEFSPIYQAAMHGRINILKFIIENCTSGREELKIIKNPLKFTMHYKQLSVLQFLVENDPRGAELIGPGSALAAFFSDNLDFLKYIIKNHREGMSFFETPLPFQIVEHYFPREDDEFYEEKELRCTPLAYAVFLGKKDLFDYIIETAPKGDSLLDDLMPTCVYVGTIRSYLSEQQPFQTSRN